MRRAEAELPSRSSRAARNAGRLDLLGRVVDESHQPIVDRRLEIDPMLAAFRAPGPRSSSVSMTLRSPAGAFGDV